MRAPGKAPPGTSWAETREGAASRAGRGKRGAEPSPAHRHATPSAPGRAISAIAHRLLMRLGGGAGKLPPSFDRRSTAMAGNRLRIAIWGLAAALWLLPLVAMQFTDEVNWTTFDFVFWAGMLLVACTAYEVVSRMSPSRAYRAGVGVAVVTGFLVVWVNGAVGMIGDEDNAWNLLFLVALVVGAAGALLTWFRPAGMARSLYATAAVPGAVALVALVAGPDVRGAAFALCFVLPWLFSAGLFRRAALHPG